MSRPEIPPLALPDESKLADNGTDLEGAVVSPDFKPANIAVQDPGLGFWTRNGCTSESFKRRAAVPGENALNQTMKPRHLNMISIGGSIGAGFFVGSGKALADGGPGALLIDFSLVGFMMFQVVYALGEMAIMFPVSGGFYTYSSRFIDPTWGFAMGWNYVFQWAIVLPLETTIAAGTIRYWTQALNPAVWVAIVLGVIILISIFGALGYAESEFWFSSIKLVAVIVFTIIGIVCDLGGGPSGGKYDHYYGAREWHPDPFKNGFKGICAVFVTAAFSFSGTELVGLAAAESKNPGKALPSAIKQVFYRIACFYIIGLTFIGLLVSANDPRLTGSGSSDVHASPFVIVGVDAALLGFDHFMNAVILVSVISIANSGVYGGSRTLCALAEQSYAPRICSYIDKSGRPLFATIAILLCGLIAFINAASSSQKIFDWLLALSGLAALFTWGSICIAHIRFRKAWKHQGHTVNEIPFRAFFGVYGSWVGLILVILVLAAQFYIALYPLSKNGEIGTAEEFFQAYLALPVVIFFFACGWIWKRPQWLTLDKIDIDTGRKEVNWGQIDAEKARIASFPAWKRLYIFLF
ncbi:amino-acid permease inda1 [Diplocarpon rosae]|nr:amino-acid permease inda1 [Diplocarpon rosae]